MRITYICRSFLDYRVPVFESLSQGTNANLTVIFSDSFVPYRVKNRLQDVSGVKIVSLSGERALGFRGNITDEFSNSRLRIPWQPGILKKIKESEPDVLIGDGFSQWTLPALVYRILKGVPLVICYERTAHTERNAQWYRRAYRKSITHLVDAMCVNGCLSRDYAESIGMPRERITTGNMVADIKRLPEKYQSLDSNQGTELKKVLNIPLDALVFLSVSRLIKLKGMAEFLESWIAFQGVDTSKSHLLVVGDGPERANLKSICRRSSLTNVTFVGEIDYNDIHNYYTVADVFLMSTLEDNWSLVVPEAMSFGLPILCSKYNGCWPELVTKKNGWVFDPMSVSDTLDCLKKCLTMRPELPEMGKQSFTIVSRHNPEHAAQSILYACDIAIGRSKAKITILE